MFFSLSFIAFPFTSALQSFPVSLWLHGLFAVEGFIYETNTNVKHIFVKTDSEIHQIGFQLCALSLQFVKFHWFNENLVPNKKLALLRQEGYLLLQAILAKPEKSAGKKNFTAENVENEKSIQLEILLEFPGFQ